MSDFKPSQVILGVPPLIGTMGRAEREFAASLIVRALQVKGDAWRPVEWPEIQEVLKADVEAKKDPFDKLIRNPFFRPDPVDLVKEGFASWSGEERKSALALTPKGLDAIRKWVRQETP